MEEQTGNIMKRLRQIRQYLDVLQKVDRLARHIHYQKNKRKLLKNFGETE